MKLRWEQGILAAEYEKFLRRMRRYYNGTQIFLISFINGPLENHLISDVG